jgi:flagellar hook-associated protein 2
VRMGNTVDGLVSGMDTTSMIQSMMKIESQPKVMLQTKVDTAQTAVASYQSVNSKLSALKNAALDLQSLSTWRGIKPTSSSSSVTATATGGTNTQTGSLTFDVTQLARAQASTARVSSTDAITTADSFTVQMGTADPVTVTLGTDKTAKGVSDAINAAGLNVKSSVVQTSSGDSVLQVTGTKTGAASSFTISGLNDTNGNAINFQNAVTAQDAEIQVGGGDATAGGYSVTSATNTFTGLMNGVTVTVGKVESGVTLNVDSDVSGIADKFQAFVDAANAALTEVSNQTAYDPGTKTSSPLTGDFMVRQLSQSILSQVSQGLSYTDSTTGTDGTTTSTTVKFGSLAQLGIQLDKTGQLTFDKDKFTAAYNADPTSIKKAGQAFGTQFYTLGDTQSQNVTAAITSRSNQIDSLNTQIDDWDVRLAAKQESLTKQYADLETALGKLKDQSSWLSGQLSS